MSSILSASWWNRSSLSCRAVSAALRGVDVSREQAGGGYVSIAPNGPDHGGEPEVDGREQVRLEVPCRCRREDLVEHLPRRRVVVGCQVVVDGRLSKEIIPREAGWRAVDVLIDALSIDDVDEVEGVFEQRAPTLFGVTRLLERAVVLGCLESNVGTRAELFVGTAH